jgi:anti-sigma factor RsiW
MSHPTCETEKIAAFIEGDLDPTEHAVLETHIQGCSNCAAELHAQRVFMCELNSALSGAHELPVPDDFARVVAVHAESDMRGVRDRKEHTRALKFSIVLGLAAFALLGVATSKAVLFNAQTLASKTLGVLGFFGKALYDAASGATVISRVLSGGLIADSRLAGLIALAVVVLAVGVLSLLISRYHRTRLSE